MLIDDLLESAIKCGWLIPARPVVAWARSSREFLMCPQLHGAISDGRAAESDVERNRWAQLEADISTFIEGGLMTEKQIKQLKPHKYEHWELISRRPRPSLRVFGRFAKPDVFVGTHVCRREGLGGMWSSHFEHQKLVCEEHWKRSGLPEKPPPGAFTDAPKFRYERYITANSISTLTIEGMRL